MQLHSLLRDGWPRKFLNLPSYVLPKPSMQIEWYCQSLHHKILSNIVYIVCRSRGKKKSLKKKIRFHHFAIILISSFFLKLLTSIANKLKQLAIELLYTRNDTTFIVVPFFSWPFVCKLARVVVSTSWNFAKFYHFETKKVPTLCSCAVCMQTSKIYVCNTWSHCKHMT